MTQPDSNAAYKGAPDDTGVQAGGDNPVVQPDTPPAKTITTSTITDAAAKTAVNSVIDVLNAARVANITKA